MIDLIDSDWLQYLSNFHTVWVGFSGGLDSTVLLHAVSSQPALIAKLKAVHIHHGLSTQAGVWVQHCQRICEQLSVPLQINQVEFDRTHNIEQHARTARYAVFSNLLSHHDGLLVAHHADDQAETVLLQLLRGAGVDGLAAMPATKPLGAGRLLRPLLNHSRAKLEAYAKHYQLTWIEDESNRDSTYSRNYLRNQVMPLLSERWPGAVDNLVRASHHCQQAKINLQTLAELDCPDLTSDKLPLQSLCHLRESGDPSIAWEKMNSRLNNLLRIWLMHNQVSMPSTVIFHRIINEVIQSARDATPVVSWGGTSVRRYQDKLYLVKHHDVRPPACMNWVDFPASFSWGEQILSVISSETGLYIPADSPIQIRCRQGGERIVLRGQTKCLKKLFQEWHVPPWQRDSIPLIYIDNQLAAVVGYAVSDQFYQTNELDAIMIQSEQACLNL